MEDASGLPAWVDALDRADVGALEQAIKGDPKCVNELHFDWTPVGRALVRKDTRLLQLLLQHGADPEQEFLMTRRCAVAR